ncbi:MAG: prephenate dehydrogenase/arogenate dehydrogenase family protein [Halanaeroarchaeum sp.]
MDALIVGAGDVGRWAARFVDGPVAFADADPDAAERAATSAADATPVALDGPETFDLVCVAVPMRVAEEVLGAQAHRAERALVDCTGSMRGPLDAMAAAAPDRERVSLHPLFAPEYGPGRVAISTGEGGPVTDAFAEALEAGGNDLVRVSAETHDEAMETIQGRAHAAVLAFGLAADEVPESLATPVYEDLQTLRERVTGGSAGVYADIQDAFDGVEPIADAARRLADADRETFEALYDDAR